MDDTELYSELGLIKWWYQYGEIELYCPSTEALIPLLVYIQEDIWGEASCFVMLYSDGFTALTVKTLPFGLECLPAKVFAYVAC